ncbi:DUF6252 family protein [Oceanihabitans sediminis]|uniref:DUF6252 family protein n=1 Tax=Oceanihabitans sediminis TaxID=1812012 RepID=UPI000930D7F3|nr:DUF6252 family protein [Oceanihabitans sediminis]MDX1279298.1 DUF6252 family protein [Oceanihabitans sediminis]
MKKLLVLLVSVVFMVSCGDELESNTPAFQGDKDGSLWKGDYYSAAMDANGNLVVSGGKGGETVVLTIASTNVGSYSLGDGSASEAAFNNVAELHFSTYNDPDPALQLYPADGEITIEEFNLSNRTVTGSFWFNAFTDSGMQTVNYSKGVFYQIPVSGTVDSNIISCDDAVAASVTAQAAYEAATTGDANYSELCNAYKAALEAQIVSCGDGNGVLQGLIDGLSCE